MSNKKQFQALSAPKGVPDYFPPQSSAFYKVRQTMVEQAHLSGFQHIELP
ncbi:MAG: histidine--tRNA ligase, partial [Corynebacterium sp.]|nr:histidine--tRNA ligase [Corynebacterium sp.]